MMVATHTLVYRLGRLATTNGYCSWDLEDVQAGLVYRFNPELFYHI